MAVGTPGGDAGRDTRTGADDRDLAARVFRRAYDAYRTARNMTLEGDIHIVGGDARRRTIAFGMAQQDAGRIRVELRQPEATTVVVSNGVTRWVYHSARGSYARGPVAGNAGLTRTRVRAAGGLLPRPARRRSIAAIAARSAMSSRVRTPAKPAAPRGSWDNSG